MTHQQELELLAEWLGIEGTYLNFWGDEGINRGDIDTRLWNPLTNDTDFLNMVAGRVDIEFYPRLNPIKAIATARVGLASFIAGRTFDLYNNDKLAAMKHAAYQVCLMAAREGKE